MCTHKKSRPIGRARKKAGQGHRQGTEVGRARKQAEGRGNRQGKETVINNEYYDESVFVYFAINIA